MGGLFGGGDSKSSEQTTTQEPWSGQAPYLSDLFGQAQDIYRQGYGQQYYGGPTVAPFSPYTQQGLQDLGTFGMYASPQQQQMGNWMLGGMMNPYGQAGLGMDYVGGPVQPGGGFGESTQPGYAGSPTPYFSGNPHLDAMVNTSIGRAARGVQEEVMPGLAAMFGGASRTGSGIQQELAGNIARDFGETAGDIASDIYGQAYESGMDRDLRRRQLGADIGATAAAMAPQFQQMQQNQIDQLLRAGAITEDQAQRYMDAEKAEFDFYQQAPWQALGQYGNIVQGMPGGYGTTTAPGQQQGSRLAGALGGAAAGAGLAGSVAALNPYTAPLAIGGGLLGLLS